MWVYRIILYNMIYMPRYWMILRNKNFISTYESILRHINYMSTYETIQHVLNLIPQWTEPYCYKKEYMLSYDSYYPIRLHILKCGSYSSVCFHLSTYNSNCTIWFHMQTYVCIARYCFMLCNMIPYVNIWLLNVHFSFICQHTDSS